MLRLEVWRGKHLYKNYSFFIFDTEKTATFHFATQNFAKICKFCFEKLMGKFRENYKIKIHEFLFA
jgi:hypothetical protein